MLVKLKPNKKKSKHYIHDHNSKPKKTDTTVLQYLLKHNFIIFVLSPNITMFVPTMLSYTSKPFIHSFTHLLKTLQLLIMIRNLTIFLCPFMHPFMHFWIKPFSLPVAIST